MVGLTFCIIMLPSARESRVARAGRRTYTRSTRRGTCRALHSRAPPKLCVGRCGRASIAVCRAAAAAVPRFTRGKRRRRHARVAECSAPGSRAKSRAAAVHRGQAQSRAAAGVRRPPAQCPAQCAPPQKCYCAVVPLPAQSRAVCAVASHRRSASAVASEPTTPWHALMAIRGAPSVRGFTLARALASMSARKVT
jgi:hypothetical protein